MCGIAGFFNVSKSVRFDSELLKRMGDAVTHRGPDGDGLFTDADAGVGLAHRRLSIIDLSGGHQPMTNEDQSLWIIFNGEIYNFQELREELLSKGYRFKTRSDTEVILKLYEVYGADSFRRLNGIFALAIYDKKLRKVVLARDPFGVKPLYYHDNGARISFGSEIKSILCDPSVERKVNLSALDHFLSFRYSPSPDTMFEGIKKLSPGHMLEITSQGAGVSRYFLTERPATKNISEADAVQEYKRLLRASVKRQMISDVPVGLFLSGGVDSAVLGKLMAEEGGARKIKTFTIGFPGKGDFNELDDARETAKLIGSEHQELTIGAKEYMDFFSRSFEVVEEPISETTISALYYVAKRASQDLKVVLAGQGADEPMGGYQRYTGISYIEKYGALIKLLGPIIRQLPRNDRMKQAAAVVRYSGDLDQLIAVYSIFEKKYRQSLYTDEFKALSQAQAPERLKELLSQAQGLPDMLSKAMFIDTRMSLPDDLLLFNDKVTMANSLEMRVPFLDHELVAFIDTLPAGLKLRGSVGKYVHKQAAKEWLPKEIIYRKKRGFQTPMDEWLQDKLADRAKALFEEKDSACRRYFRMETIQNLIAAHKSRKQNNQKRLYALLSFEMWHRTWINKSPILIIP